MTQLISSCRIISRIFTSPDSLVVRMSASGAVGHGFAPRLRHTKGGKNGTGSPLADARNKRVVQEDTRKQVSIRYSLCRSKSSTELMLSVSKRDVKHFLASLLYQNWLIWPPSKSPDLSPSQFDISIQYKNIGTHYCLIFFACPLS